MPKISFIIEKSNRTGGNLFTAKDSFIWFTLFNKFIYMGLDDGKFAEFLTAFKNGLDNMEIDGKVFKEMDKDRSTKCKSVISDKLDILEKLMHGYLDT